MLDIEKKSNKDSSKNIPWEVSRNFTPVLSSTPKPSGSALRKSSQIVRMIFIVLLLVIFSYTSFLLIKINRLEKEISPKNKKSPSIAETISGITTENFFPLLGENKGRINILLLGIAGEKKPGQNLTDTIIIASIDSKEKKVSFLSLPRDLLVKYPETQNTVKINSIYSSELRRKNGDSFEAIKALKKTIGEITNLPIHYFVILNFDGFEKIIDSIGGVNITNEKNIFDARYPGPNYSYETFELKKGFHHLDGKTALKYVRVRHGDSEGDFGRAKRQQEVMQATKNRIFSIGTLFNFFSLNNLFDALGENIKTDISVAQFGNFFDLIKKLDTQNINTFVVDAWKPNSLLRATHIPIGNVQAFGLVPRTGNWKEIQEVSREIFSLRNIQRRQEEIAKEDSVIYLINSSGDIKAGNRIQKILSESFGHKNISILPSSQKIEAKSTVFDLSESSKPFTLDEMINHLGAQLSENNSTIVKILEGKKKRPDFVLVIGKDLEDVYNVNDVSLEEWEGAQEREEDNIFNKQ